MCRYARRRTHDVGPDDGLMERVTPGWRFLHVGFEGDQVELDGVRLWGVDWGRSQGRIVVAHPSYPDQRHLMWIYRIPTERGVVAFAAGEFSNGVWGFFMRGTSRAR